MTGRLRAATLSIALVVLGLLAWEARARAADIRPIRSPGGISAWLVEEKSLPIIAIRFAFDGGSTPEAVGKEGTAGLLPPLLGQGARDLPGPGCPKQVEKPAGR